MNPNRQPFGGPTRGIPPLVSKLVRRGLLFAIVAFIVLVVTDSFSTGSVTVGVIFRAASIAFLGAFAYAVLRLIIAWVKE